jgi:WhiB family redox-sensing transcriptional regulator
VSWTKQAACRGQTAVMFSEEPADQQTARDLCAGCPVVIHCAVAAVRRNERYGIWGGWTPSERAELVKAAKRRGRVTVCRAHTPRSRMVENERAAAAGAPPQRGGLDTPRSVRYEAGALAPSRGPTRTGAVLQVSRGVGGGSPALPAGFAGVWGGCEGIPGE